MRNLPRLILVVALVASCAEQPTAPAHGHAPQSDGANKFARAVYCDLPAFPSGKLNTFDPDDPAFASAFDRYDEGLVVNFVPVVDQDFAEYPKNIRLAMSLVADSLYALCLPSHGIGTETKPHNIRLSIRNLDSQMPGGVAKAEARFFSSGMPRRDSAKITINSEIFQSRTSNPHHLGKLGYWYTILFHEVLHTMGFGLSPKWESMQTGSKWRPKVCGTRIFRSHWFAGAFAVGGPRPLMDARMSAYGEITIAPATFCVLEGIGWELRNP